MHTGQFELTAIDRPLSCQIAALRVPMGRYIHLNYVKRVARLHTLFGHDFSAISSPGSLAVASQDSTTSENSLS